MSNYKNVTIACYYSYQQSHILIGGVDFNERLIIQLEYEFARTSIDDISLFILELEHPVWINIHAPLKSALGGIVSGELNFDSENEIERTNLDDFYYSLKDSGRISIASGVRLQGNSAKFCLKILLKGMMTTLCRKPKSFQIDTEPATEFNNFISDFDRYY